MNAKNDISARFIDAYETLLNRKEVSDKRDFATKLGISASMITEISKGRSSVGTLAIQNIVSLFNINADWLLTGRGNMINDSDTQLAAPTVQNRFSLKTDHPIAQQSIPLYELDATAGLVSLFDTATRHAPVSHLQIPDLPPCDGALYVRGDSMYPLLKSGDIVLYKEISNLASGIIWGEMYLLSFVLDGESYITIKYIQKADTIGFVRLASYNPHFSPQDIPTDSIRALALIKASVRFNTMG